MPLWFMRHGQTNFNLLGLCNDDPRQDVHLTGRGIAQAEAAAEHLREKPLRRILVSELPRTRQTAEIINRYHQVVIDSHPELNDIRSGFNGRPVVDYFAATAEDPLHMRVNGGESLLDHKQRVERFLEKLQQQQKQDLLIVAHEETLRVVAAWFRGLPETALRELHFKNCEVLEFEWR